MAWKTLPIYLFSKWSGILSKKIHKTPQACILDTEKPWASFCGIYRCHITPLLVDLHWLDIKGRIDFKIILLTFKAIHGQAPAYICELVNLKPNSSYGLRSNNKMLLSTLNFRTLPTLGDRAFAAAAPKLWNAIPLSIRQEQNLEHLKKKLKTYLFLCNYKSMEHMYIFL